jgi:hypothetical protein
MHFVKTGGFNGHIEYYERMVSRIIPFRKRLIAQKSLNSPYSTYENLRKLPELNDPAFLDKVNTICADNTIFKTKRASKDSIVSELFQLDILLILPGQELPMHLNVPYFWSADRSHLPQWLLVLMKKSKLFNHLFIPQVQGINWLNLDEKFKPVESDIVDLNGDGGDFYFYPYLPHKLPGHELEEPEYSYENVNRYVILKSVPNSVILLDGAQVIHGVDRFKPNELPPLFGHKHDYKINFDATSNKWHLFDSQNTHLKSYSKNEVKLLVSWNAHCFVNHAEREKFFSGVREEMSLESIMDVFKSDLRKRRRLPSESIEPLELWTIVLKEYLKYPVNLHQQNSTIFGINYCLLPNVVPTWFTNLLLKPYLSKRC